MVEHAPPEDLSALNGEVTPVLEALNDIEAKASGRQEVLDRTAPLAQDYQDALQALADLVQRMEDKVATRRAFGPEPEKVSEEIADIKVGEKVHVDRGA